MTFFSCRLLTTPIFPRRLSSVFSKFSHKKLILGRVSPPGGCHPGRSPSSCPPSDTTGNDLPRFVYAKSSYFLLTPTTANKNTCVHLLAVRIAHRRRSARRAVLTRIRTARRKTCIDTDAYKLQYMSTITHGLLLPHRPQCHSPKLKRSRERRGLAGPRLWLSLIHI